VRRTADTGAYVIRRKKKALPDEERSRKVLGGGLQTGQRTFPVARRKKRGWSEVVVIGPLCKRAEMEDGITTPPPPPGEPKGRHTKKRKDVRNSPHAEGSEGGRLTGLGLVSKVEGPEQHGLRDRHKPLKL